MSYAITSNPIRIEKPIRVGVLNDIYLMPHGFGDPEAVYFTRPKRQKTGLWRVEKRRVWDNWLLTSYVVETFDEAAEVYEINTGHCL